MVASRPRSAAPLERRPLLIGVVHLPPLPGAPRHDAAKQRPPRWQKRAVTDARTLADAGFDAVIVENFGDAPFYKDVVPPETIAAMSMACDAVRAALPSGVAVGANVLRNDARAALGIAAAAGLELVRVNVLIGTAATDQGLVEGRAAEVLRARAALCPAVKILADVHVKHARPVAPQPIEDEAQDLARRGGADMLIVTGTRTGGAPDLGDLERVRAAVPDSVLLAGSGVTAECVAAVLAHADGVIVGTALKRAGRTSNAVDAKRAAAFVRAARG